MLKFFKRMERTRNFVLLLFAILMVLSLILFYAPTRDTGVAGLGKSEDPVAKVGSEYVTVGELVTQQQSLAQRFGGRGIPSKTLLDGLIRSRIARIEAEKLGLRASDAEVANNIREQFKTDDGKPFDQTRYERIATEQAGSVANFEQQIRDSLSAQKLQAFITSGVTVSEDEVLDGYKRSNSKFDLTYVPVSVADLAQSITPTDEELKAYFDKNKASYYISSPQKKIRYLYLNTVKIGEKVNIPDADLKAEYDKLPADKKIAGVKGQEIVLRVPKPEFDADIAAKANQLVERLRKDGGKISEEAFAEIAKGQSENPNTARSGGTIPGLVRQNPNKPDDPYQRILTMQEGEVSDPIQYQDRYYIVRRGAEVPKPFEDAKKELDVSLRNRRAYTAAADLAQKAADRLKEVKDVQKVAQEFAPQTNMSAAEMVKETPFVKPGDSVADIGVSPQFEEGIAGLENLNDVGDKIPVTNGFAIPLLVEKKEPRDADFAEVRDQIVETYKVDQARQKVEEIAKQIASAVGSAGNLSAAATAKGLKAQDQKSFILGSPLGQGPTASTNEALEDAIWGLKEGEVTKTPIKVGDNWYIVGLNKREEADMEDFAKQRDSLIEQKLTQKRGQVFSDYLASIRNQYETDGKIKIYTEEIEKIDALTPPPSQPAGMPPGFPPQMPQPPPQG
ncbi:MAG: peptidyl-prolyl cis-trans isomerase [Pyrinomonadaceae bacterium]